MFLFDDAKPSDSTGVFMAVRGFEPMSNLVDMGVISENNADASSLFWVATSRSILLYKVVSLAPVPVVSKYQ